MNPSPFPHQGPLSPAEVRGRDDLLADLTGRVTRRAVTALVGPRRYGKTSVLRRLAADLTEVTTVWVDLYGVASAADLAVAFDTALDSAGAPVRATAGRLALTAQIDLGAVKATLSRPARSRPDPDVLFPTLLDLVVATALTTPTMLVLDEFSAITTVPAAAAKLRTALQHHYRDIAIVFAGSAPSVMRTLFTDREEPFYGQADLVDIGPLDRTAVHGIVTDGFISTGRDPERGAALVHDLAGGHPQRTMQLADALWHHTPDGGSVTDEVWADALTELRQRIADPMSRIFDGHPASARKTLRIVAHDESPHGAAGQMLALSKNAATKARKALLDNGDLIRDTDNRLVVTDPMLADWIRTTLPIF